MTTMAVTATHGINNGVINAIYAFLNQGPLYLPHGLVVPRWQYCILCAWRRWHQKANWLFMQSKKGQGRAPGLKAHRDGEGNWRNAVILQLHLGLSWYLGPLHTLSYAWHCPGQQIHNCTCICSTQILEEETDIRRYLWQCLNVVRA